jgi:hypothetical protein
MKGDEKMTSFKEKKLDEIRNIVKEIYGDMVRVDIGVTADGLEVTLQDRGSVKGYSMRRIDGSWCSKESQ